jgi:alanine dehydrogenase
MLGTSCRDHLRRADNQVDGLIHLGIANMSGAAPHTSSWALINATVPYVRKLADSGWTRGPGRRRRLGLNTRSGR